MANRNGRGMWVVMSRRRGTQDVWAQSAPMRGVRSAQEMAQSAQHLDPTIEAYAVAVVDLPTWTGPKMVTLADLRPV